MSETMIERAAQALRAEIAFPPDDADELWMVEGGYRGDDFFRDAARAVITAMREPTEGMKRAGMDACGGDGSVLDGYEAMIDGALAEEGR